MSYFSLPNRLKESPSSFKKFWTSFTTSLYPKLCRLRHHTLKLRKTFFKTTTRLLDLRHKRHHSVPRPPLRRRGGKGLYNYKQQYHQYYQHLQPYSSEPSTPSTVYVDGLFREASSSKEAKGGVRMKASTSGCSSDYGGGDGDSKKIKKKVGNKWKEYVSSMPKIKGVDERAEEFISKFRQQISLQREQSIIEFQEMLARSA